MHRHATLSTLKSWRGVCLCGNYLGIMWKLLGIIWELSGNYLGIIWELSDTHGKQVDKLPK